MIRAGVIGFGLAGQVFHAPTIKSVPGMELACILERSGSLAQQKFPGVRVARTLDELLADEQIRLCVIATSNVSHFDLARRCLLAGRDAVVDKPFTTTSQEAAELIHLAGESKRVLSVYQNRRWDGDFQTVRKILDSGVLGRIVEYESHFDRFRPQVKQDAWREKPGPGNGLLFDLAPHLLDHAFVLFGPPAAITANISCQRDGAVTDDAFDLRLDYPGLRVVLHATVLGSTPGPRFLLYGSKGSFVKFGLDPQEDALRRGELPGGAGWGEESEAQWGTLNLANGDSITSRKVKTEAGDYRGFYENVRDAIVEGKPLAVKPQQALQTMRGIELAVQSHKERRTIDWHAGA